VVDSNSDPEGITYPIPGNDDATRAINLYCDLIAQAVLGGLQAEVAAQGSDVGASAEGMIEKLPAETKIAAAVAKPEEPAKAVTAEAETQEPAKAVTAEAETQEPAKAVTAEAETQEPAKAVAPVAEAGGDTAADKGE
jgi:small subunit ribosomal protein S2